MLATANHTIYKASDTFPLKPYQLMGLWDMIEELHIAAVSAAIGLIIDWRAKLSILIHYKHINPMMHVNEAMQIVPAFQKIEPLLLAAQNHADNLKLTAAGGFVREIIAEINRTRIITLEDHLGKLIKIFEQELNEQKVIYVPPEQAKWYNDVTSCGSIIAAFPSTENDIKEAFNCFALDRSTACVFHLMRVLEYGLDALATSVGLVFDKQQWHTIIEGIEAEIKKQRRGPLTDKKKERLQFLSEAAKEFMYFKDGWRNHVTHRHIVYDIPQAASVLGHVKTFMSHISGRLKE